jgi:ferrous iron transport protein A
MQKTLANQEVNKTVEIVSIENSEISAKLLEFGVIPGMVIVIRSRAPFGGPLYVSLGDSLIALRRQEAALILVK